MCCLCLFTYIIVVCYTYCVFCFALFVSILCLVCPMLTLPGLTACCVSGGYRHLIQSLIADIVRMTCFWKNDPSVTLNMERLES